MRYHQMLPFDISSSAEERPVEMGRGRHIGSVNSEDGVFKEDQRSPVDDQESRSRRECVLCNSLLVARADWSYPLALIEQGGPPLYYVDKFGKSALHYAIRGNAPAIVVESLLRHGLDPNLADVDGWTPLHLFVRLHKSIDEGVVGLLLQYGGDPNQLNRTGESSVFLGTQCGVTPSIMNRLLNAGGNPNTRNMEGETPLILAARYGGVSRELITELLADGADPWLRDNSGRNALDWGREKGHELLVKQMRKVRYQGK